MLLEVVVVVFCVFACFVVLFLLVFGGCQNFCPAHVSHAAHVSQRGVRINPAVSLVSKGFIACTPLYYSTVRYYDTDHPSP
jgi:hypothetical protein